MLLRSLVLLLGLALQSSLAAAAGFDVQGKVLIPESVPRPSDLEVLLSLDTGKRLSAIPAADGRFSFGDVPTGVHLLDVVALGLLYPSIRLDVGESGSVSAAAADVPGTPALGYPLQLTPVAKQEYFERRQGFSILGFLKTPYGLMIAFMVFSIWVMPKLKIDAEEYKEMQAEKDKLTRALTGKKKD